MYCQYDFSRFMIFPYKMTELGMIVFDAKKTFKELKDFICDEITRKLDVELDREHILVREHILRS